MSAEPCPRWYVTFGSQYSYLMHPFVPVVHPDAVVQILAPDCEIARELTVRMFGQKWSDLREWDAEAIQEYYPAGVAFTMHWQDAELATLVISISQSTQDEWVASMVRPAPERELIWGDSAYAGVR